MITQTKSTESIHIENEDYDIRVEYTHGLSTINIEFPSRFSCMSYEDLKDLCDSLGSFKLLMEEKIKNG